MHHPSGMGRWQRERALETHTGLHNGQGASQRLVFGGKHLNTTMAHLFLVRSHCPHRHRKTGWGGSGRNTMAVVWECWALLAGAVEPSQCVWGWVGDLLLSARSSPPVPRKGLRAGTIALEKPVYVPV